MSKEIKGSVKETYTNVVTKTNTIDSSSCCAPACCGTSELPYTFSEDYTKLEGYEEDADYALGCGLPTEHANIKEGNTVLDLGSGAGNDVFIARSIVGEKGQVIGVDMTEAMIEQANKNKEKLGYENIYFRLGEIEDLPVEDNTIDVAVSNCVMNLVPDKNKAYQEVYRTLKQGGHFSISDIVLRGDLPEGIKQAAAMYAGCISGALSREDYLQSIKNAGFKNLKITKEREVVLPDEVLLQFISQEELETYMETGNAIISIGVYAEK